MTLVPLGPEHAEAMAAWVEDPEVVRGLGLRRDTSLASTRAWIERALPDPTCHPFAILAGDIHVGNVVLDQLDDHLGTARLSIFIGPAAQRGAGVGARAVELVAGHARAVLALHKLWLVVHAGNARAIAAYRRAGFETEGRLRDEFLLDGERTDALRMGLLLRDCHA